jgi:hypothetical protein
MEHSDELPEKLSRELSAEHLVATLQVPVTSYQLMTKCQIPMTTQVSTTEYSHSVRICRAIRIDP